MSKPKAHIGWRLYTLAGAIWRRRWWYTIRPWIRRIPCRLRGHNTRFNRCLPPCSRWF